VQALGSRISLDRIQEGRAHIRVEERTVSCAQGETFSVGRLTLRCTGLTQDAVTFTGALG
jgi:hypothetical protein